jgi:hypothetical protein
MNAAEQQIADILPEIFADDYGAKTLTVAGSIPEGQRDASLTSLAGSMRRGGCSVEAIAAALHVTNEQRCQPPLPHRDIERIAQSIGRYTAGDAAALIEKVPALRAFNGVELQGHTFEYRRPLLLRGDAPIFREGELAELFGLRGLGKTLFSRTVAHIAATPGAEALGFRSEEAVRVLYVDGEMAGPEIQERDPIIQQGMGIGPSPLLTTIAADWQDDFLPRLDTPAGQAALEPFVDNADLIILDNRSCLFDPEGEKDPSRWQPAQDWLLSLRRRRKAVLMIHHSNRQGGARGHSKPEDAMNLLIKLSRPEGYTADQGARFVLEFEKSRGVHGSAVAPFTACLTPDGWQIESASSDENNAAKKLREYLRLADKADERPKSANAAITAAKIGRNAGLEAWAALKNEGALKVHPNGGFYIA